MAFSVCLCVCVCVCVLTSHQVKYKQSWVKASSVGVTPELERVRQNQENISSVKYQRGLREMKGHSCTELDTPEYRRVRRSQDSVSTVAKYHEDFERARGRGCAPGLDEPGMERYQRANQMMGEAGYGKGTHPQAMEMDRRPGEGPCKHSQCSFVDLKAWRTDPGSIFDFDPLEDDVQSKSLRRTSGRSEELPSTRWSPLLPPGGGASFHQEEELPSTRWSPLLPPGGGGPTDSLCVSPSPVQVPSSPERTTTTTTSSTSSSSSSSTRRVYRALYDYAAQDHDEVSFRDGDVIVNAQPIDEGWMYGTVQRTGKSGMLPANYVEFCN
uniref:SH3 domain-containing protein n=1 Tax=Cyclopterus lumpus TaxID=8103 RepID=A0A8C2XVG1_CYCLU